MKRIIDQTLEVPIGRKDGAVVLSMMKMPRLVDEGGMFPMMMGSLCISNFMIYFMHLMQISIYFRI